LNRSWVGAGTRSLLLLLASFLLLGAPAEASTSWFAPGTLSDTSQNSFDPDVAVDGNGRAIAVWTSNGSIKAAFRVVGGKFVTESGPTSTGAFQPQVAMDSNGLSVAVWTEEPTGVNARVVSSTRPVGGGWSTPVTLSTDTTVRATDPQISIDPQGNAVVVWVQNDKVLSAARPSGGPFSAAEVISDPSIQAYQPQVAAEPNGEATAVWTRFPGTQQIQFARRRNFTDYSKPVGASPLRLALVPSFQKCETPGNSIHGPPLNFPSCSPPQRNSTLLAVGQRSLGFGRFVVCDAASTAAICGPLTKPDLKLTGSISDVRNLSASGTDYDDPDGLPDMTEIATIRMTDSYSSDGPATVADFAFAIPMDCVTTADTTIGSTCSVNTTMNAITPGAVKNGKGAVLELKELQVYDQGADGIRGNGDDKVFEAQGFLEP